MQRTGKKLLLLPFFREVGHFSTFFWRLAKKDTEIVFYAEHAGYFVAFEGLIAELKRHRQHICYITSSNTDPVLERNDGAITALYINRLLPIFMFFVTCRVLVMTMPDLGAYHIKRSLRPVHYVYIFHSLISTHMGYRPGAFDQYDSVLCAGPHQVAELRLMDGARGRAVRQLVPAGYWRLERLYAAYRGGPSSEDRQQAGGTGGEHTVLIAPSWGEQNLIERHGEPLVAGLLAAGFRVIVRPHPETWRRRSQLLENMAEKFSQNSRFTLERSVAGDASLLAADVLICDLSGVALEYALGTERPVLFIDIPPKVKNPAWQQLGLEPIELALRSQLGVVVSPQDIGRVYLEVRRLIASRGAWAERLGKLRNEAAYNFGRSSEAGAQHVLRLLAARKEP